ncbi:hypothetical protein OGAPHI_004279 [Ogataea philodendri]|uniref:Cyclin-like domain-containing protein n=1 Tax=Ogataea philodendri TaxID=1378263 RepID=A0A9P8P6E6_9ASCO|nr:uncharacterized protein OGAPHI_004279 [Ogataea philodendri]KAH3666090.1 hypothetical protein OGAPHI_004279 [Ogataea philodendri]
MVSQIEAQLLRDDSNLKYDTNMRIYLHQLIVKLGRKLNLRQVILSTAEVYLTRFFAKVSIREVNIYLLVTTCIYISCKMEESPQHIRTILSEARNCWPEFVPNDLTKLAEFEFYLIEELDCYMVVHHPYNSILDVVNVLKDGDPSTKLDISPEELQTCWSIINDSYITDLHLLFPPHIIAIGTLYITLVLGIDVRKTIANSAKLPDPRMDNFVKFLASSNIDLSEVIETVQEILTLYEIWNSYDEMTIRNGLHHMLLNMNR